MSSKRGTYLIEFKDGTSIVCGNNYKEWFTHAVEYAWSEYQDNRPHDDLLVSVKFSDTPFVDDGGLKFATPKAYDQIIESENAKDGKKRIAFGFIDFYYSNSDKKRLERELKYWGLIK
jgi:hypothetical protein